MVSFYGNMMNFIFRCMPQYKPGQPHDYAAERKRNDRTPPKPPRGVVVKQITLGGLTGEEISKAGNNNGIILYIHGGGFTVGSARERRAICQYIAANYGFDCVTFNYRLAPENLWPAPLDDSLTAYIELIERGISPQNIVLMGESAGGTLTLSLAVKLKEMQLPQPKAIAAFSPCVTVAETLPSHVENSKTDYMLTDGVANGRIKIVFGDRADDEALLHMPTVSPLYADFDGLPPVFLSASDTEALLDDSIMLLEKLSKAGHKTELDIQHGVCHAFQVFTDMPEAKRSLKKTFEFLEKNNESLSSN